MCVVTIVILYICLLPNKRKKYSWKMSRLFFFYHKLQIKQNLQRKNNIKVHHIFFSNTVSGVLKIDYTIIHVYLKINLPCGYMHCPLQFCLVHTQVIPQILCHQGDYPIHWFFRKKIVSLIQLSLFPSLSLSLTLGLLLLSMLSTTQIVTFFISKNQEKGIQVRSVRPTN